MSLSTSDAASHTRPNGAPLPLNSAVVSESTVIFKEMFFLSSMIIGTEGFLSFIMLSIISVSTFIGSPSLLFSSSNCLGSVTVSLRIVGVVDVDRVVDSEWVVAADRLFAADGVFAANGMFAAAGVVASYGAVAADGVVAADELVSAGGVVRSAGGVC
jgi:hypothetical protein